MDFYQNDYAIDLTAASNRHPAVDDMSFLNSSISIIPVKCDGSFWNPFFVEILGIVNISSFFFATELLSNRNIRNIPLSGIIETPTQIIIYYKTISPYLINEMAVRNLEIVIINLFNEEYFNYDFMEDFQIFFGFICNETIMDSIKMKLSKYGLSLYFPWVTSNETRSLS